MFLAFLDRPVSVPLYLDNVLSAQYFDWPLTVTMEKFQGVIIEESLSDKEILTHAKIISTKVEKIKESHQTPWLSQWTLHTVEIKNGEADCFAGRLSASFDQTHNNSWYADFKNGLVHYVIFPGKIFKINRKVKAQYEEAKAYGISLGIPEHQCDFDVFYIQNFDNGR